MTLQRYANEMVKAGRFPATYVEACGLGVWLYTSEGEPLGLYPSLHILEKRRSAAIARAVARFA